MRAMLWDPGSSEDHPLARSGTQRSPLLPRSVENNDKVSCAIAPAGGGGRGVPARGKLYIIRWGLKKFLTQRA